MTLNCDTYIKQEFLNAEEELMNSLPNTDLNIPVKNEPISDECFPAITIKNEPLLEATYIEETVTNKTESVLQNQQTSTGCENNFIIYELETPPVNDKLSIITQQTDQPTYNIIPPSKPNIQICNITETKEASVSSVDCNLQQSHVRNTTTNDIAAPTVAAAPPILLNAKLRKRHKVVLPVNPIDKRTRYNIEGTNPALTDKNAVTADSVNTTDTLSKNRLLNAGCKKIINHLIKRKCHQSKKQDYGLRASPTVSQNPESPHNKETHITPDCISRDQSISPSYSEHITQITTNTQTEPNLITTLSPASSMTSTTNLPTQTVDPPTIAELRVKCLCSLIDDATTDNSDLKTFFNEMFEETRHLNKRQQRQIKLTLLKAISDAEESLEQGKCCGFV